MTGERKTIRMWLGEPSAMTPATYDAMVQRTGEMMAAAEATHDYTQVTRRLLESLVAALNDAHDALMTMQGADPAAYDWPEHSPQAIAIREAEKLLGRRLAKTEAWTLFRADGERTQE